MNHMQQMNGNNSGSNSNTNADNTSTGGANNNTNNERRVTFDENSPHSWSNPPNNWSGLQIEQGLCLHGNGHLKPTDFENALLLDTGSTFSLIKNPKYVHNLSNNKTINMQTNAGNKSLNVVADMPGLASKVYFDRSGIANIFALIDLCKDHRVQFDSAKDLNFYVTNQEGKTVLFEPTAEGLWAFYPVAKQE